MFWAETTHGKRIPMDAQPVLGDGDLRGKYRVVERLGLIPLVVTLLELEGRPNIERASANIYVSHFATCPQSKTWRKK